MRDKDDLDLLIDSALTTYADPGADAGLEQRVLARIADTRIVSERGRSPRRRWLPWAIALPLASGLVLLLLSAPEIKHSPSAGPQLAHESALTPAISRAETPAEIHSEADHHNKGTNASPRSQALSQLANAVPLPKLDVFPSPQPPTQEEQALVVMAMRTPSPQLQALAQAQNEDAAPSLPIATVHFPPLQPPTPDPNDR
jgi:hypothetical protein